LWVGPGGWLGAVMRALLEISRDGGEERALAEQICRAYMVGLDIEVRRSRC
jgi:hypothetical protein